MPEVTEQLRLSTNEILLFNDKGVPFLYCPVRMIFTRLLTSTRKNSQAARS